MNNAGEPDDRREIRGRSKAGSERPVYSGPAVGLRNRLTSDVARAYLVVLLYGVLCTVELSLERAFGTHQPASILVAVVSAAVVWWIGVRRNDEVVTAARSVSDLVARVPARTWIVAVIIIGCGMRIAWTAVARPVPNSDYLSYLTLASSLVERGEYWIGHTCFFRPPGVSLALAPLVAVFGPKTWVPLLQNLVLFSATVVIVFFLARRVADARVARASVALLAVWPNGVFLSGLASKELLLLFLLPAAVGLYLRAAAEPSGGRSVGFELAAGLVLGACILTQPTFLFMVGAFALFELVGGTVTWSGARRLALLLLGAALMVSPWTLRNYVASGRFLLVSANGGHALWVGNNPQATGGYVSVGRGRTEPDEITYNREALAWALSWIRENPRRFMELVVRRQALYLGDDADGAYWVLKRGLGIGGARYAVAKGLSNAFWIAVLALGVVSIRRILRDGASIRAPTVLAMLPLLFQVLIFSVTESGGRHHVAIMGFLVILSCLSVASPAERPMRGPSPNRSSRR
jgi:4-amino-4-deoxy-L-arabinose transferase-like glycosyltransferase